MRNKIIRPDKKNSAKRCWSIRDFFCEVRKSRTLLLMLAPSVLLIFIFAYLPIGGVILAFKRFNYRDGILGSPWVDHLFDNFRFFFISGKASMVTWNTFLYNLSFIIVNTVLAVGLAVILSEMKRKHLKRMIQSLIFLPFFLSWVIVGSIAYNLLNYENGVVNTWMGLLGMEPLNAYNMPNAWRWIIVVFNAWKGVGYSMVVYLAAVIGVDAQMYEAAEIDGANIFHRVRYITLPVIFSTIITLVLLDVSKIFRGNFDLFYQLVGSNGALYNTTDVIDTFVFRSLLQSNDIGMAAASGLYQSVLCLGTILLVNGIVRKTAKDYALF